MSFAAHVATLALVIVDLVVGGPVVSRFAGRWALIGFEFALILGYVLLVLQLVPWRHIGP